MSTTPYVIGITGHRALDECATRFASDKIKALLEQLQSRMQVTPLVAITGMACGADRLLARAALELGIPVEAHLPMPLEEYRRDFNDAEWQDMQQLLANPLVTAQVVEQLHGLPADQPLEAEARDIQYWVLGQHLVSQCNLLIAVWDGDNTGLTGGTSDVLLDYLDAQPRRRHDRQKSQQAKINYLYREDSAQLMGRLAYWIPVTRQGQLYTRDDSTTADCYLSGEIGTYELECFPRMPGSLWDDVEHLEEYNQQTQRLVEEGTINPQNSLLNHYEQAFSPIPEHRLQDLDKEFLKADAVAIGNQKHSDSQFTLFSLIAASMGFLFLIYAKLVASKYLLIGYLLLFFVGWRYYRNIQQRHSFTNHLTARVLAETLRTELYLVLIGRNNHKRPTQIMNSCGVSQFQGFNWIKHIILSKVPMHLVKQSNPEHLEYNVQFVCDHWLLEQADYFERKTHLLSHRHHKLEHIKSALFVSSAVMALLLILFKYPMTDMQIYADINAKSITVLLMGLLPFLLGVWEIYQNKMAVKELLWQYRTQSILFNEAKQHIETATTLEQKCAVLSELAERALLENYIWIIHRYHREHEPPAAG
ncbi:hypothetical protein [Bowmanella dokdonensis]|uniref:SMODS and SLOG-associating 2TM effector domain-containing protein n=1 Tax=Bowmanella dokdonensis TaxID=751969 RepID=A0A939IRM1_9ALTE|nr:hypothetical protein [Bowmanella dokdonensis]MBN7825797.1 hypothetical protein [Bowmanella dokdonensis]